MESKFSGEIQEQETRVNANQIQTFLQENASAIDNSVREVIQKDYTFLEKYVTKKGLVKLVDEIKKKQIRNVGQFYDLIYKIESDGKLKTASEFVQLKVSRISTEFQEQFRKFADHKLVVLGDDTHSTRMKVNAQIEQAIEDIEKYKHIDMLYTKNVESIKKQLEVSFDVILANYDKFKNTVQEEAKKYNID